MQVSKPRPVGLTMSANDTQWRLTSGLRDMVVGMRLAHAADVGGSTKRLRCFNVEIKRFFAKV